MSYPNGTLTWYDVNIQTDERVKRVLVLTPELYEIVEEVWDGGVFYINSTFDYGSPVCEKAIQKAKQLHPPEIINYRTLRVNLSKYSDSYS